MKRKFFTRKKTDFPEKITIAATTEQQVLLQRKMPVNSQFIKMIMYYVGNTFRFLLLLITFFSRVICQRIFRFLPKSLRVSVEPAFFKGYFHLTHILDGKRENTISRMDLIELSIKNMKFKKTRSLITVGGMAIGVGTIVFLVSIGYGLQELVIGRIARLEEMRQADVSMQPGSARKMNDKTIADFNTIEYVKMVLPVISVVGRITYQNSISDVAVYGVTSDYLTQSAIKPVKGKVFESNEVAVVLGDQIKVVEQPTDEITDEIIREVTFRLDEGAWIPVRTRPANDAPLLGYTTHQTSLLSGKEVFADPSSINVSSSSAKKNDEQISRSWIHASVLLWKSCLPGDNCIDNHRMQQDARGFQIRKTGYIAADDKAVFLTNTSESDVLGIEDTDQNLDFVEIASESGLVAKQQVKRVALAKSAKKQAIVNRSLLQLLGISEEEAIGKTFATSFVVVGELLPDTKEKVESQTAEYTIIAVTPDEKAPIFYVPFIDLRSLGIVNFSQLKLVAENPQQLAAVRTKIAGMGYATNSVADTVAQVTALFATARTILALLGMVALAVAALGMFNTLTVSLLERTREVGLMKAMGMKSSEVRELFLTESMTMGFFGGILGILMGFFAGKILSIVLSTFSLAKGAGIIDVTAIPMTFIVTIVILSLLIGIVTGIYPARRATKISALNALRYE